MITSLSKNRLKQLTKLHQKKYRDLDKQFLISGLRAVQEVLKNPQSCVEIIIEESKSDILFELNAKDIAGIQQYSLTAKDFNGLVDEKNPQGICLVVEMPTKNDPGKIDGQNILYLDKINDPGNLGTIIRSAAWFGINAILLSPQSADPYQIKVTRSTAGNILNLPIYQEVDIDHLKDLKKSGYSLIGTNVSHGKEISLMKFPAKRLFLLGSEAHGLNKELQDICEEVCYIKRFGKGDSLNLANAASIIMHQMVNNEQ